MNHISVLLKEVITVLRPHPYGVYIDATVGDGGHTEALLEGSSPTGRVIGIDQDERQLKVAQERLQRFKSRLTLICAPFSRLSEIAKKCDVEELDGILFDLGVSSRQLSDSSYGLSFMEDTAILDMRLSKERHATAADILNTASEREIADLLYSYGDRYNSRSLARKIVNYRRHKPFQVAYDLKEALQLRHPSVLAPIFQALRIAVNEELTELEKVLPQALALLKKNGTMAVISFHSNEDRIVKRFFRQNRELLEVPKKIVRPTYEEIKHNPRARSALLRSATKL